MKIVFQDPQNKILLQKNISEEGFPSGYSLSATVSIAGNSFCAQNDCVHITDLPGFINQYKDVLVGEINRAILDMTEGCRIEFVRWNQKGDIAAQFRICKYATLSDPLKTTEIVLSGQLNLNSQYQFELLESFQKL